MNYLADCKAIAYQDFLSVHRMLFSEFYPWAGQDRATTAPNSAVTGPASVAASAFTLIPGDSSAPVQRQPGQESPFSLREKGRG